jgi:hypothetical protein
MADYALYCKGDDARFFRHPRAEPAMLTRRG